MKKFGSTGQHVNDGRRLTIIGVVRMIVSWRWISLIVLLILRLGQTVITTYMPQVSADITNYVTGPNPSWIEIWPPFRLLFILSVIVEVLTLSSSYLQMITSTFMSIITQSFVLKKLTEQDMSFFHHPLCAPNMLPGRIQRESHKFVELIFDLGFPFVLLTWEVGWTLTFVTVRAVPWDLAVVGMLGQLIVLGLNCGLMPFLNDMQLEMNVIMAKIDAANQQLIGNLSFIEITPGALKEVVAVRQRQLYELYDIRMKWTKMQSVIQFAQLTMNLVVDFGVWFLGIDKTIKRQMSWGDYQAFRHYIGKFRGQFQGYLGLRQSGNQTWAICKNLVEMMRTPVIMEIHHRDEPFVPERPDFDKIPGAPGSDMSMTLRQLVIRRRGHLTPTDLMTARILDGMDGEHRHQRSLMKKLLPNSADARYSMSRRPEPFELKVDGLSFHYPYYMTNPKNPNLYDSWRVEDETKRVQVLNSVSLHIKKSEIVALRGGNGCGKSTLYKLLSRLYPPDEGSITINGVDAAQMNPVSLRCGMGILTQVTPLFVGTIVHNVFLGRGSDIESCHPNHVRLTRKFIEESGFPVDNDFDLERQLDRQDSLSPGQLQRVALLRLCMHEYSLLLLDEPENSLDREALTWLIGWLELIKKRRHLPNAYKPTIIIISHRPELQALFDREITLPDRKSQPLPGAAGARSAIQIPRHILQGHRERLLQNLAMIERQLDLQQQQSNTPTPSAPPAKDQKDEKPAAVEMAEWKRSAATTVTANSTTTATQPATKSIPLHQMMMQMRNRQQKATIVPTIDAVDVARVAELRPLLTETLEDWPVKAIDLIIEFDSGKTP
jgi:ABC-type multidrug transport system fused ATPase/permease subunit